MNETINPLAPSIRELFAHLNVLYGLLFHLKSHLNSFRKMLLDQLEQSDFDVTVVGAGSAIVIRDLTEWPEDNWARYYPTGSFTSQGEEYLRIIDVLLARESAWSVSQAYEAFETFLKDLTASYLHSHPHYADERKLRKVGSNLRKSGLESGDVEYWKRFVRITYRSGEALLEYLRDISSGVNKAEQHNNRGIDLSDWFAAVSEVRHAVTHSNMIVKQERIACLSEGARRLLTRSFPGSDAEAGYELSLEIKNAEMALKFFSEYALLVFKCLSEEQHYTWERVIKPATDKPEPAVAPDRAPRVQISGLTRFQLTF